MELSLCTKSNGSKTVSWKTGVRFPVGAGNFSLGHRVHIGSGAHRDSYTMGTEGYFPREVKRPGRETDHSPPSSSEVELYLPSPIFHGVVFMAW
jgi:hypothetical protein